jgi:hypothetical protein
MGGDSEASNEDQVEKKPEVLAEGDEAYDTFVANTMMVIDCLLMLRSEKRCVVSLIFLSA